MSLSLILTSLLLSNPLVLLSSYVSMGNSFPQPLTDKEEAYYLKLYESGDKEAKNILVERNLRLVAHIAKKYGNTGKNPDDLISIGTIGLIKAVNTYKVGRSVRLATYAAKCIENEILMSIRSNKKARVEISLNDPIGTDKDGNEISFNDILGTDADAILDDIDNKIQVKKLYTAITELLKDRERSVIIKRFGLSGQGCKTQREVAKELGISRSYVSRIEKKAISKLKEAFSDELEF
ncbi:RNA polymerase sporulation sigma factor SigK [Anaerovorax sp. IOR16]|uniref:RNA polymerase sporulation sigma factor SigK n=1 Tax=Anaerovorax sp. IOR16 TaxID=2773458 RepID=UPI0019D26996|nr:RNA polymerase sporulation sigma factor SigK [Anaerovorax sp. IOR16]MEA4988835.1 RNA polymerase sporulation sigma factor SigK [Anaerovorax sp.]